VLGRVTANFTHEPSNPLATLLTNYQLVNEEFERFVTARDAFVEVVLRGDRRETLEAARVLFTGAKGPSWICAAA
jgi:hypothetical protein